MKMSNFILIVTLNIICSTHGLDLDHTDKEKLCPCFKINDCPRIYGESEIDIREIGFLESCPGNGTVRCCGISVSGNNNKGRTDNNQLPILIRVGHEKDKVDWTNIDIKSKTTFDPFSETNSIISQRDEDLHSASSDQTDQTIDGGGIPRKTILKLRRRKPYTQNVQGRQRRPTQKYIETSTIENNLISSNIETHILKVDSNISKTYPSSANYGVKLLQSKIPSTRKILKIRRPAFRPPELGGDESSTGSVVIAPDQNIINEQFKIKSNENSSFDSNPIPTVVRLKNPSLLNRRKKIQNSGFTGSVSRITIGESPSNTQEGFSEGILEIKEKFSIPSSSTLTTTNSPLGSNLLSTNRTKYIPKTRTTFTKTFPSSTYKTTIQTVSTTNIPEIIESQTTKYLYPLEMTSVSTIEDESLVQPQILKKNSRLSLRIRKPNIFELNKNNNNDETQENYRFTTQKTTSIPVHSQSQPRNRITISSTPTYNDFNLFQTESKVGQFDIETTSTTSTMDLEPPPITKRVKYIRKRIRRPLQPQEYTSQQYTTHSEIPLDISSTITKNLMAVKDHTDLISTTTPTSYVSDDTEPMTTLKYSSQISISELIAKNPVSTQVSYSISSQTSNQNKYGHISLQRKKKIPIRNQITTTLPTTTIKMTPQAPQSTAISQTPQSTTTPHPSIFIFRKTTSTTPQPSTSTFRKTTTKITPQPSTSTFRKTITKITPQPSTSTFRKTITKITPQPSTSITQKPVLSKESNAVLIYSSLSRGSQQEEELKTTIVTPLPSAQIKPTYTRNQSRNGNVNYIESHKEDESETIIPVKSTNNNRRFRVPTQFKFLQSPSSEELLEQNTFNLNHSQDENIFKVEQKKKGPEKYDLVLDKESRETQAYKLLNQRQRHNNRFHIPTSFRYNTQRPTLNTFESSTSQLSLSTVNTDDDYNRYSYSDHDNHESEEETKMHLEIINSEPQHHQLQKETVVDGGLDFTSSQQQVVEAVDSSRRRGSIKVKKQLLSQNVLETTPINNPTYIFNTAPVPTPVPIPIQSKRQYPFQYETQLNSNISKSSISPHVYRRFHVKPAFLQQTQSKPDLYDEKGNEIERMTGLSQSSKIMNSQKLLGLDQKKTSTSKLNISPYYLQTSSSSISNPNESSSLSEQSLGLLDVLKTPLYSTVTESIHNNANQDIYTEQSYSHQIPPTETIQFHSLGLSTTPITSLVQRRTQLRQPNFKQNSTRFTVPHMLDYSMVTHTSLDSTFKPEEFHIETIQPTYSDYVNFPEETTKHYFYTEPSYHPSSSSSSSLPLQTLINIDNSDEPFKQLTNNELRSKNIQGVLLNKQNQSPSNQNFETIDISKQLKPDVIEIPEKITLKPPLIKSEIYSYYQNLNGMHPYHQLYDTNENKQYITPHKMNTIINISSSNTNGEENIFKTPSNNFVTLQSSTLPTISKPIHINQPTSIYNDHQRFPVNSLVFTSPLPPIQLNSGIIQNSQLPIETRPPMDVQHNPINHKPMYLTDPFKVIPTYYDHSKVSEPWNPQPNAYQTQPPQSYVTPPYLQIEQYENYAPPVKIPIKSSSSSYSSPHYITDKIPVKSSSSSYSSPHYITDKIPVKSSSSSYSSPHYITEYHNHHSITHEILNRLRNSVRTSRATNLTLEDINWLTALVSQEDNNNNFYDENSENKFRVHDDDDDDDTSIVESNKNHYDIKNKTMTINLNATNTTNTTTTIKSTNLLSDVVPSKNNENKNINNIELKQIDKDENINNKNEMKNKTIAKLNNDDINKNEFRAPKMIQRGFFPILPYSEQDPGPILINTRNTNLNNVVNQQEKMLRELGLIRTSFPKKIIVSLTYTNSTRNHHSS